MEGLRKLSVVMIHGCYQKTVSGAVQTALAAPETEYLLATNKIHSSNCSDFLFLKCASDNSRVGTG